MRVATVLLPFIGHGWITTIDWTLVTGAVSAAALVASVLFLALQTRQLVAQTHLSNQGATFDAYQSAARDIDQAMSSFVQLPLLRKYFFGNVEPPQDEATNAQVLTIGEWLLDALTGGVHAAESAPSADDEPMKQYATDMLSSSPILRDLLATHPGWWPRLRQLEHTAEGGTAG